MMELPGDQRWAEVWRGSVLLLAPSPRTTRFGTPPEMLGASRHSFRWARFGEVQSDVQAGTARPQHHNPAEQQPRGAGSSPSPAWPQSIPWACQQKCQVGTKFSAGF